LLHIGYSGTNSKRAGIKNYEKDQLLIAVLGLIAASDSMTMANEIKMDFDRSGAHGSVTELIAKITAVDYTENAAIPMPVACTEEITNEAHLYQDKLVLARTCWRTSRLKCALILFPPRISTVMGSVLKDTPSSHTLG
jgi:hypothetical protein